MACGDRYKHLAVTSKGYTPENTYGVFYLPTDYADWTALADKLVGLASTHMAKLQAVEAGRGKALRKFNALSGEWAALLRKKEDLPTLMLASASDLPKVVDVVNASLCLLEQVDDAIASYGVDVPEIPTPGRGPAPAPPTAGGLFDPFFIALVVGGYLVYRGVKGSE